MTTFPRDRSARARFAGLALATLACGSIACPGEVQPPAPPPAAKPAPPAPAPAAQPAGDAGEAAAAPPKSKYSKLVDTPNDGLSLMERVAKRKAADAKLAAELAEEEKNRVLKYDKGKLAQHTALLAFERKTRKQLDDIAAKAGGNPAATAALIKKTQTGQAKALTAQGKALAAIDPKGGNSMIVNDHGVVLESLGDSYPAALIEAAQGDAKAITEQRAELDTRLKKIEDWLGEVRSYKPGAKKSKKKE